MFNLLLLVFVFAVMLVILALAVVGAIIFRKKSANPKPPIDPNNVIDVTPKDVQ